MCVFRMYVCDRSRKGVRVRMCVWSNMCIEVRASVRVYFRGQRMSVSVRMCMCECAQLLDARTLFFADAPL